VEAPDCVGRHVRAHGCGLRACEAYGRAVVEEVRGAAEGERIVSGLFLTCTTVDKMQAAQHITSLLVIASSVSGQSERWSRD